MSNRVRTLKLGLMAAGLVGLLPALGAAQGFNLHRKAGMWDSTMMVAGRALTSSMCTDEAFEKKFSVVSPQQMGARDCSNMVPTPIPGGYRVEGTCNGGGRTSHITATVKGDFNNAYAMDLATEVNGKAQPPVHMDVKWTGPCGAGVKPGDIVMTMPDGKRMVINAAAMAGAAGGRPGPGGR
jgi:hypothetical protein